MSHRGIFRAFLSVVPASITAAALLGSAPAHSKVTIDIPCSGTWNWDAATKTLSCTPDAPPIAGAPTCALAAAPGTLPAGGGPLTLTATCTNSPTGYTWSASPATTFTGGADTGTTSTNGATISANTTFTVTATNGTGSGQASKSVQVGAVVAGAITCPGFAKTLVVNWDWGVQFGGVDTWNTQGGLGTNGILVVPFKPTPPTGSEIVQISAAAYPAAQMTNTKRIAISERPCDLTSSIPAATASGPTISLAYIIGPAPISYISGKPQAASLTPGVQYYINIAERSGVSGSNPLGTQTCVAGVANYPRCEFRLSVQKPSGH